MRSFRAVAFGLALAAAPAALAQDASGGDSCGKNHFILDFPCEEDDPSTWTWSSTPDMSVARFGHTATLLDDGTVLVAGGGTASAELYDPASRRWNPTGAMNVARYGHAAVRLPDGRVLVVGGDSYEGSAELYDPQTRTWRFTGSLLTPRLGATLTVLANGTVLLAGGFVDVVDNYGDEGAHGIDSSEIFDPASETWRYTSGNMNVGRLWHSALSLADGRVLVTGGSPDSWWGCDGPEIFDPASDMWVPAPSFDTQRSYFTATVLGDGSVLAAGGLSMNGRHDRKTGRIYFDPIIHASTDRYDARGAWIAGADLQTPREQHTATLLARGILMVTGGLDDTVPRTVGGTELYDPSTNSWHGGADLGAPRYAHTATLLMDGTVLVTGGLTVDSNFRRRALSSAEIFARRTQR